MKNRISLFLRVWIFCILVSPTFTTLGAMENTTDERDPGTIHNLSQQTAVTPEGPVEEQVEGRQRADINVLELFQGFQRLQARVDQQDAEKAQYQQQLQQQRQHFEEQFRQQHLQVQELQQHNLALQSRLEERVMAAPTPNILEQLERLHHQLRELEKFQVPQTEAQVRELEALAFQAAEKTTAARDKARSSRASFEQMQQEMMQFQSQLDQSLMRENEALAILERALATEIATRQEKERTERVVESLLQQGTDGARSPIRVLHSATTAATTAEEAYTKAVEAIETARQDLAQARISREQAKQALEQALTVSINAVEAANTKQKADEIQLHQMEEIEQYLSQKTRHSRQVWDERLQRRSKVDHQLETMREDLKQQQASFQQLVTRHEKHIAMSKQLTQLSSISGSGGYGHNWHQIKLGWEGW